MYNERQRTRFFDVNWNDDVGITVAGRENARFRLLIKNAKEASKRYNAIKSRGGMAKMTVINSALINGSVVRSQMSDGKAWFSAMDVCAAYGIPGYKHAASLIPNHMKKILPFETGGGSQKMIALDRAGVDAIAFASTGERSMASIIKTQTVQFDGQEIRFVDSDGKRWFCAKDVCAALGLSRHKDRVRALPEGARKLMDIGCAKGAYVVDRFGAANLSYSSRSERAYRFQVELFEKMT